MEIRHLSYAVAVARAGSFSKAAAELRLAQPSLSAAIAQLETELGARLFERSSRGVALTSTGAYVVRQARRLLDDVDAMKAKVRMMIGGSAGTLSIGVSPPLAWKFAPPILREFTAAAPDVELSVRERNVTELIELVLEGVVDVAIVATASTRHLRDFNRGTLMVENLGVVSLIACLPARYAPSPDPIPISAFAHEEVAMPPASARTYGLKPGLLRAFDRAGLPTPRIREAPSLFEAVPLAMAGVAVAIVPEGMRGAIESPDMVLRHIENGPEPLDISMVWRADLADSAAVSRFVGIAVRASAAAIEAG